MSKWLTGTAAGWDGRVAARCVGWVVFDVCASAGEVLRVWLRVCAPAVFSGGVGAAQVCDVCCAAGSCCEVCVALLLLLQCGKQGVVHGSQS